MTPAEEDQYKWTIQLWCTYQIRYKVGSPIHQHGYSPEAMRRMAEIEAELMRKLDIPVNYPPVPGSVVLVDRI